MEQVRVLAPAKVNLTLDITGLDGKGYHIVDSLAQTIDLCDTVHIGKTQGEVTLTCNRPGLPAGEDNLAVKAARAFFAAAGLKGAGAAIGLEKAIPSGAGLGGGSADAAGVLAGLNILYATGFSPERLAAIGAPLGADVPFAVIGGTARLTGTGTQVSPLPPLPPCRFLVCMPGYTAPTAGVYARYDVVGPGTRPHNDAALAALSAGDLHGLCAAMGNALEKASGGAHTLALKTALLGNGALAAQMTGSGAAVFGLFETGPAADKAMEALWELCPRSFLARPCAGLTVEEEQ